MRGSGCRRRVAVQGNLDPMVLMAGGDALEQAVRRIRTGLGDGRFIFNLGHGILPQTPVDACEAAGRTGARRHD